MAGFIARIAAMLAMGLVIAAIHCSFAIVRQLATCSRNKQDLDLGATGAGAGQRGASKGIAESTDEDGLPPPSSYDLASVETRVVTWIRSRWQTVFGSNDGFTMEDLRDDKETDGKDGQTPHVESLDTM